MLTHDGPSRLSFESSRARLVQAQQNVVGLITRLLGYLSG